MMAGCWRPGMGANMGPYERGAMAQQPTLASVLSHLVPRNPVQAMGDGKILQVIVFAVAPRSPSTPPDDAAAPPSCSLPLWRRECSS